MRRELINCMPSAKIMNAVTSSEFKVHAKADDDSVELMIYDHIGRDDWTGTGIGANDVAAFLADHKQKPVNVRVNSPGGLVWDGISIHNSLVQHGGPVIVTIEGVAASAASVIAMAGEKIRIFENAQMMVHRAWGIGIGNSREFLDLAEWLEKVDGTIAATYAAKTGRKADSMLKLMDGNVDGTWFTAAEAVKERLADEIVALPKGSKRASNDADERVRAALENERRIKNLNAAARVRQMEVTG